MVGADGGTLDPFPWQQCRAYLRARGVFSYSGRRCTLAAGHAGKHETARNGIGEPFAFRWGRA